jgi:hypothetical protein
MWLHGRKEPRYELFDWYCIVRQRTSKHGPLERTANDVAHLHACMHMHPAASPSKHAVRCDR